MKKHNTTQHTTNYLAPLQGATADNTSSDMTVVLVSLQCGQTEGCSNICTYFVFDT